MDLAKPGPREVGQLGGQGRRIFPGVPSGRAGLVPPDRAGTRGCLFPGAEPVATGVLGHPHHGVGQQQAVGGSESGIDQRGDGLGDGLLHPDQGGAGAPERGGRVASEMMRLIS